MAGRWGVEGGAIKGCRRHGFAVTLAEWAARTARRRTRGLPVDVEVKRLQVEGQASGVKEVEGRASGVKEVEGRASGVKEVEDRASGIKEVEGRASGVKEVEGRASGVK
jgi:hypothetical protein